MDFSILFHPYIAPRLGNNQYCTISINSAGGGDRGQVGQNFISGHQPWDQGRVPKFGQGQIRPADLLAEFDIGRIWVDSLALAPVGART